MATAVSSVRSSGQTRDSYTVGGQVPYEQPFRAVLERELNKRGYAGVRNINAGVGARQAWDPGRSSSLVGALFGAPPDPSVGTAPGLRPPSKDQPQIDPHFTTDGHRLTAELLAQEIVSCDWIP